MRGPFLRAGAVALAVIGLDQLTKALARGAVARGDRESVFFGINLVNVRNDGVAFGLLSNGGAAVIALTIGILLLLLVWFALQHDRRWLWLATGMLVGGAAGNLIDRLVDEAVTDFIDLPLWPAFNLADIAITAGVVVLILSLEEGTGDRAPGDG